ncbi:phage holin family protein [Paenibacillus lactis]|uniref:phage holin n=1 Tax=Paenibacillus lactis TaxID=228574 RepID=UPI00203ABDD9|nr:phage holin family protein [Paenibacillus lactis]
MNNSKWRNYGLWVSIVSAVLLVVASLGKLFGFTLTEELSADIMAAVASILGLLVILGIISNPKEGTGYKDENK